METMEQIERLKKEIRINNQLRKRYKRTRYAMNLRNINKVHTQELKELEDGNKRAGDWKVEKRNKARKRNDRSDFTLLPKKLWYG